MYVRGIHRRAHAIVKFYAGTPYSGPGLQQIYPTANKINHRISKLKCAGIKAEQKTFAVENKSSVEELQRLSNISNFRLIYFTVCKIMHSENTAPRETGSIASKQIFSNIQNSLYSLSAVFVDSRC